MVEKPPVVSTMTTDTLVLSKVVVRSDGTRIITEPDGTRRVEHRGDGGYGYQVTVQKYKLLHVPVYW